MDYLVWVMVKLSMGFMNSSVFFGCSRLFNCFFNLKKAKQNGYYFVLKEARSLTREHSLFVSKDFQ